MTRRALAGVPTLLLAGCILGNPDFDPFGSASGSAGTTAVATAATAATTTATSEATTATAEVTTGASAEATSATTEAATATTEDATSTGETTGTGTPCAEPAVLWAVRFHGEGAQYPENVAISDVSDIAVLGTYSGELRVGDDLDGIVESSAGKDAFIARFTQSGELQWLKAFKGDGGQVGEDIDFDALGNAVFAVDNGGSVDFGGGTKTNASNGADAVLVRLNVDGAHLTSWAFASPGTSRINDVVVEPETDDIVIAGMFTQSLTPEPGNQTYLGEGDGMRAFVARLTSSGTIKWLQTFKGPGESEALAVDVNAADVVVAGRFAAGAIEIAGETLAHQGAADVFVARLKGDTGGLLRARRTGGAAAQRANEVALDAAGDVVVGGTFLGDLGVADLVSANAADDVFLGKLGADATTQWSLAAGAEGAELTECVAVAPSGAISWGANFSGDFAVGECLVSSPTPGFFLAELTADGAVSWAAGYSAAVDAGIESLDRRSASYVAAVGWHRGGMTIGGHELAAPADALEDGFLIRVDPTQ
ncbi:MAG: hypothetical protein R3A79_15710 [Nannocystaceae bacterium]